MQCHKIQRYKQEIILYLSFENVPGQGYDQAGTMTGNERGRAKRLRIKYPLAVCPLIIHKLNIYVVKIT